MLPFEDVIEPPPEICTGLAAGEPGQRITPIVAHHPQIIDTMAVVCMVMRPENRVDLADVVGEQLRAQIGGGVDEYALSRIVFDYDRHARAAVARLERVAFAPVIADPRHPGRGARPKHSEFHAEAFANKEWKLRVV